MQLDKKSSTISSQDIIGNNSSTTDVTKKNSISPDETELYLSVIRLNREVSELKDRLKELEEKQEEPDADLSGMVASIKRLGTLIFILLIILPIVTVATVAIVVWFKNPDSLFAAIASWVAGGIGLGALIDAIIIPIKFSKFKEDLDEIKKQLEMKR